MRRWCAADGGSWKYLQHSVNSSRKKQQQKQAVLYLASERPEGSAMHATGPGRIIHGRFRRGSNNKYENIASTTGVRSSTLGHRTLTRARQHVGLGEEARKLAHVIANEFTICVPHINVQSAVIPHCGTLGYCDEVAVFYRSRRPQSSCPLHRTSSKRESLANKSIM